MGKKSIQMLALVGLALATLIALSESVPSPATSPKKQSSSPTNSPKRGQHAPPHNASGQHQTGPHAQSPHPGTHDGQTSPGKPGSPGKAVSKVAGKAAAAGGKAAAGANKKLPGILKEAANEIASHLEKENEKAKPHVFKPVKYSDFVKPLAGKLHTIIAKAHHEITVKMIEEEEKKTKKPEQMDEFKRIYIKVELLKAIHEATQKKTLLTDLAIKLEQDMSKHQKKQQKKRNPKLDKTARGLVKEIVFEHISTGFYGSKLNDKNPKTKSLKNEIKKALAELEKDNKHSAHVKDELNKLDKGMAPAHGAHGQDAKAPGVHGNAATAVHGAHGKAAAPAHGAHGTAAAGKPKGGSPQQSPHGAHGMKGAQSPAGTSGKKDVTLSKSPSGKGAQLTHTAAKGLTDHHEHESHSKAAFANASPGSLHHEGGSDDHQNVAEEDYGSLLGQEETNLAGVKSDPESRLGEEAEREYGSIDGSDKDENPMMTSGSSAERPPARALDDVDNDDMAQTNVNAENDDSDRLAPFSESMNNRDTEEVDSAKFGDEENEDQRQSSSERLNSEKDSVIPNLNPEFDQVANEPQNQATDDEDEEKESPLSSDYESTTDEEGEWQSKGATGMDEQESKSAVEGEGFWDKEDLNFEEYNRKHAAKQAAARATESAVPSENVDDEQIRGARDTESMADKIEDEDKSVPLEGESASLAAGDASGDELMRSRSEVSPKFSSLNATEPNDDEKAGDDEEMGQQDLGSPKGSIEKTGSGISSDWVEVPNNVGEDEEMKGKKPTEGLGAHQGA